MADRRPLNPGVVVPKPGGGVSTPVLVPRTF